MVRAHSRWCGPARSICMQSMEPSQILSLKQLILWIITQITRKAKIVRLLPCFFPSSRKMPAAPATGLKLLVGAGSLNPHALRTSPVCMRRRGILWIMTRGKKGSAAAGFRPPHWARRATHSVGPHGPVPRSEPHGLSPHSPPDRAYSLVPWYVGGDDRQRLLS